jgi:dGTPase
MAIHGGYEHNRFGLRLVETLETRYPNFPGLNLTWEVRESMAYHSKRPESPEVKEYLVAGQPFLEAQLVDAADSLAYDCHDLDDALSAGLIDLDDLNGVEFVRRAREELRQRFGDLSHEQLQPALVRTLIDWQVNDLLQQTRQNLAAHRVHSVDHIRRAPELMAEQGREIHGLKAGLEEFLHREVYRHYRVARMTNKAQRVLRMLFDEFRRTPTTLPPRFARRIPESGLEQTICDYLASMTDRSAQDEYLRLFHPYESV